MRNLIVLPLYVLMSCQAPATLPDPLEAGWKGSKVCVVLEDNPEVRILKCTFPPGVGHEKHYHKPHFAYTLTGSTFRMRDTTGTRDFEVPTGLHYYSEGVVWHEPVNVGKDTAVFLIIEPR